MRIDLRVLIDACVLANFPVCDLLLRLAESPRMYRPIWSMDILDEVHRTQVTKLKWDIKIADSFQDALLSSFPEAIISGYDSIIPNMTAHEKDRHVLAAAVYSRCSLIVTFNLRHFPEKALKPWGVKASHPDEFLLMLYKLDSELVNDHLEAIARKRHTDVRDLLELMSKALPCFTDHAR